MRLRLLVIATCAILGIALPTRADTIRITGGALDGSDSSINGFEIVGTRLLLSGIVASDLFGEPHWRCDPLPCPIGSSLSLSSRYSGFEDVQGTVDGVEYSAIQTVLDFTSSSITIPNLAFGENAS